MREVQKRSKTIVNINVVSTNTIDSFIETGEKVQNKSTTIVEIDVVSTSTSDSFS